MCKAQCVHREKLRGTAALKRQGYEKQREERIHYMVHISVSAFSPTLLWYISIFTSKKTSFLISKKRITLMFWVFKSFLPSIFSYLLLERGVFRHIFTGNHILWCTLVSEVSLCVCIPPKWLTFLKDMLN